MNLKTANVTVKGFIRNSNANGQICIKTNNCEIFVKSNIYCSPNTAGYFHICNGRLIRAMLYDDFDYFS